MPKVLVANRGEIAIRIFKTARKKGWACVAVYSDADRDSLHLEYADEAYFIGPSPATESYLNIPAILKAAKESNAGYIHPGYGFLSEKAEFAQAVADAGIQFIGPTPASMQKLGSKISAKQIAKALGIPLVPGHHLAIKDQEQALHIARDTGIPLIIKAAAGGGGKGMRVVHHFDEIEEAIGLARAEALASFGDDRLFIEKYIENPRHIEVQIMADQHGNCVYFPERECSIQRRYQKLMEESPCNFITDQVKHSLYADALNLAKASGYTNTGTVEFIIDSHGNYYFLEMNTRLQVEHTVTEMLTGLDLVDLQLEVALGHELPLKQEEIIAAGHAMQWRIYAENPQQNFAPSTGTITHYQVPELPDIRIDSGYISGKTVSIYYDPMIAKLISRAHHRADCIENLKQALVQFELRGIETSIPFGIKLLQHPDLLEGNLSTGFLDQHLDEILNPADAMEIHLAIAAAAYYHYQNKSSILQRPKF
ncbi:MAG: biotin carboxylase N-terminal domain-containing protein [Saprospiraceae bacterium]|nr:biotin carboxylase N-terminal domain-containing protein [Saprospiraceae bacterium]